MEAWTVWLPVCGNASAVSSAKRLRRSSANSEGLCTGAKNSGTENIGSSFGNLPISITLPMHILRPATLILYISRMAMASSLSANDIIACPSRKQIDGQWLRRLHSDIHHKAILQDSAMHVYISYFWQNPPKSRFTTRILPTINAGHPVLPSGPQS